MRIHEKVKDEKLQYDMNREAAKISALSSGKIDKYEYLTGEEILPSDQSQIWSLVICKLQSTIKINRRFISEKSFKYRS